MWTVQMRTLDAFLDDLSSSKPVPGGGSVAALETAMAAALLEMVANLTIGRKRYADVEGEAIQIRDRSHALRKRAESLAEEDVEAFGHVGAAMSLPRDTEEQKATRREQLQSALKLAAGPPLETMQVASEVARLAETLVRIGNRSAISDVGTAVLSARSGYHAARLNVEINLSGVKDEAWRTRMREEMQSISDPDALERSVMSATLSAIQSDHT